MWRTMNATSDQRRGTKPEALRRFAQAEAWFDAMLATVSVR